MLSLAGPIETPTFLPNHTDESMRRRTYLRVPLAHVPLAQQTARATTVWLVQLAHIKTGGKKGPSFLGSNAHNKKIQILTAARRQGREAAAASSRGADYQVVPITMGDMNLNQAEVSGSNIMTTLLPGLVLLAASDGVLNNQGRRHQDLILVEGRPGITLKDISCDVFGFDGTHQAVQARLCRDPEVAASAAASAEAAEAAASTRSSAELAPRSPAPDSPGFEPDWDGEDATVLDERAVLPMGADVIQTVRDDTMAVAAQEDDEATVADTVGSDAQELDDVEQPRKSPRTEPAGSSDAPADVASTLVGERRRTMRCCIVVTKKSGSEKYTLVLDTKETVAEIDRILAARNKAVMDEAHELYGASTLVDAKRHLFRHGRIVFVRAADRYNYMVLDFELQRRSRYYAFQEWASTPEGEQHLWKQDRRSGWWSRIPRESDAGRFVLHRDAKGVFKTYCDHAFGGQTWFDVLNQMGGCPAEFVDAYNAVMNQRLQVAPAINPPAGVGGGMRPRSAKDTLYRRR